MMLFRVSSEKSGSLANKYLVLDTDLLMIKGKDTVKFLPLESYNAAEKGLSLSQNKINRSQ